MSTLQSSSAAVRARKAKGKSKRTRFVLIAAGLLVLCGIVLDTTVVHVGSEADVRQQAFSPDTFGAKEFPRIQSVVLQKALDAVTIAPEVLADKVAAGKKYGTASTTGTVMMVKFSGTVGEGKSGIYEVSVPGMPADIKLRMQTGPAINGTDLRDAPGDIAFGSFKNQIEYQDAGSAINRAMKAAVLDPIDTSALTGKTVDVVGAFRLVNPKNWMVTPVKVDVK
jgi:predicted lipoprotein